MISPEELILLEIERVRSRLDRPVIVALDGGSGAGKSTISNRLRKMGDVAVITLDDFYQTTIPESEWPTKTAKERLESVFEWKRVRLEALLPLRAGNVGRWQAFDFTKGLGTDGRYRLQETYTEVPPSPIVVLEGNFSASPPVRDLIDLAVLIDVPVEERHRRIREREDEEFLDNWHTVWDEVEAYYYNEVNPPDSYDLVVKNNADE